MIKDILRIVTVLLFGFATFLYFDIKKYFKMHENDIGKKHNKRLTGKIVAMLVICLSIGVISIIVNIIM